MMLKSHLHLARFFLGLCLCLGLNTACRPDPTPIPPPISPSSATPQPIQALALHLKQGGAKMYGAFWCPYCSRQQEDFGPAFQEITYIECDPRGQNAQPQVCQSAGVSGFPTWEINGQFYPGYQSLEDLANLSNYTGPRQF